MIVSEGGCYLETNGDRRIAHEFDEARDCSSKVQNSQALDRPHTVSPFSLPCGLENEIERTILTVVDQGPGCCMERAFIIRRRAE